MKHKMATQQEIQEQFDALVAQHGAPSVNVAIANHIQPNVSGGCGNGPACGQGYICVNGQCKLDVGN